MGLLQALSKRGFLNTCELLEEESLLVFNVSLLQEVNSVEAIKSAVACNLGVAFVSKLAIEREVQAGQLHALNVEGIPLTRSLRCVADPARYQSRAVRAFIDLMFDPAAYHPQEPPTPLEEEASI